MKSANIGKCEEKIFCYVVHESSVESSLHLPKNRSSCVGSNKPEIHRLFSDVRKYFDKHPSWEHSLPFYEVGIQFYMALDADNCYIFMYQASSTMMRRLIVIHLTPVLQATLFFLVLIGLRLKQPVNAWRNKTKQEEEDVLLFIILPMADSEFSSACFYALVFQTETNVAEG